MVVFKEANTIIAKLRELGAPAHAWLAYIDGTPTMNDSYIVSIGRVLRATIAHDLHQHASYRAAECFSRTRDERIEFLLSRYADQCLLGIKAAHDGKLRDETLVNLIVSRDDLASLDAASRAAFCVQPTLADNTDFFRFLGALSRMIEHIDGRIDFSLSLDDVRGEERVLRTPNHAHLFRLADFAPLSWWLTPLSRVTALHSCT